MASYTKIAISLPLHAAEHVRRAVRFGRAKSVSAYITEAIEEKAKQGDLQTLIDEMLDETGGPMTDAERLATDRLLGYAPPARQKRRRAATRGRARRPSRGASR
jgi:Arc/MetJ-type ribon-helix-helix transcriptional regulator